MVGNKRECLDTQIKVVNWPDRASESERIDVVPRILDTRENDIGWRHFVGTVFRVLDRILLYSF